MENGFSGFHIKGSLLAMTCAAILAAASQQAYAITLDYRSIDSPSLAVFNNQLFMAFAGTDSNNRLNYAVSTDGQTFSVVTDPNNRAGSGPAIAPFNGKMYVVFPFQSNRQIAIASSTDGQHYSGQHIINPNWNTPVRPALGAGAGRLWLAWQGFDGSLYEASTADGTNWSFSGIPIRMAQSGSEAGTPFRSFVIYPPTLATSNDSRPPGLVYTFSQHVVNFPNTLMITGDGVTSCQGLTSPIAGGIQAGIGFLGNEILLAWRNGSTLGNNVSTIQVNLNGGSCVAGGITYPGGGGSFGQSHSAPAVIGYNGHAYLAFTGIDSDQHISVNQLF